MVCVIYTRVSGAGQVEASGLERQEDACRALASQRGWEVREVYREEGVSGTKDAGSRPGFARMMAELELEEQPRVVLVEHLDRLARYYRIQEELLNTLVERGITLYAANTGEDVTAALTESPMRRFLVQMQGLMAELDRSQTVLKLTKGRAAKRAGGGKAEGQYAFGRDPKRRAEISVLELMQFLQSEGNTAVQIAGALNARGHANRSGAPWQAANVGKILRGAAA